MKEVFKMETGYPWYLEYGLPFWVVAAGVSALFGKTLLQYDDPIALSGLAVLIAILALLGFDFFSYKVILEKDFLLEVRFLRSERKVYLKDVSWITDHMYEVDLFGLRTGAKFFGPRLLNSTYETFPSRAVSENLIDAIRQRRHEIPLDPEHEDLSSPRGRVKRFLSGFFK